MTLGQAAAHCVLLEEIRESVLIVDDQVLQEGGCRSSRERPD